MNTSIFATAANSSGSGTASLIFTVGYIGIFALGIYFLIIRPQKKQQQKQTAMQSAIEIGDSVLTTAGFYGVIIGVEDDTVVVEFGNNKNCRIPMQKAAIVEVEKQNDEV